MTPNLQQVAIEVSTHGQPMCLVRGISNTRGSIPTFFAGEQNMAAGDHFDIAMTGTKHAWRMDCNKQEEQPLPKGSRLIITNGLLVQELFSLPDGGNDPYVSVRWVGDLDGDGKSDLYLNTSWHYNISH